MLRVVVTDKYAGEIGDFEKRKDLHLVTDSQDVNAIKNYFGNKPSVDYDSFLVKIENGEYKEVYGFDGTIPRLDKPVFKIEQKFLKRKSKEMF